jgi:hypothetical protein
MKDLKDANIKYDNINCTDLLTKANREIKCLKYKIQKVIPTSESHMNIIPNKWMDIEVIEENFMAFQVICKDQLSPARFHIQYRSQKIRGRDHDVKIFYSAHHKEPNDKQNQQVLVAPDKFAIPSLNKKKFLPSEAMYLSFYSFQGSSISIRVTFPEQYQKNKKTEFSLEDMKEEEKRKKV